MESNVSLKKIAADFLATFGYGMDAVDFINFIITEADEGIHRLFFAEHMTGHEYIFSKMAGMISAKHPPIEAYMAFHNIFDPEIPVGRHGLLTLQSMPFRDPRLGPSDDPQPYELRVYLISHHAITMYGADDAEEFMSVALNDPDAQYCDAWCYEGMAPHSLRNIDFG